MCNGSPYPATAEVAGVVLGVDASPAASLERRRTHCNVLCRRHGRRHRLADGAQRPRHVHRRRILRRQCRLWTGPKRPGDFRSHQHGAAPDRQRNRRRRSARFLVQFLDGMEDRPGLDGGSLISATANGSEQSQAAWWFSMPAGVYELSITYTPAINLTRNLGLDLYDGVGHWMGQVSVNEQVAPRDFTDQGVGWKRLGSFKITTNAFHISTWNSPTDGAICVDAIQMRAVAIINDGDASGIASAGTFSTTGTWATSRSGAFGDCHVIANSPDAATKTASWTMPVTPGGTRSP